MKIDGFKIGGFANIDSVNLDVDGMNALVAPNGYGKSNVLHGIEFGVRFLGAEETERRLMMGSRWKPVNTSIEGKNFNFEIRGSIDVDGEEHRFVYGYAFAWADSDTRGRIVAEGLRMKRPQDQRLRQMISRSAEQCLIVPSATGRCNKGFAVADSQLALTAIAGSSVMFLHQVAQKVSGVQVPNLESLDNPESYFSVGGGKGIAMLGGMTLSEYLYHLKESDAENYALLEDGVLQLVPNLREFSPEVVTLPDGQRRIYDVRVRERFCSQPTSIVQLSSGSKRMIFLFTLCVAARRGGIPVIMMEEPENSVHPRLMENLLLMLREYASGTAILMTSHSPYLMRYLDADQMYFGLPGNDGLARFERVNASRLKQLYRYAGDLELTFGEFMFDFMLDMEGDDAKVAHYFRKG